MANGIRLEGYAEYQRLLKKAGKSLNEEARMYVYDAALSLEEKAKMSAPTDQGRLKNSIRTKSIESGYEVVVDSVQAPWMEWGTKSRVQIPSELASYAAQFKGEGQSGAKKGEAKRAIFDWAKRKGIPPERWYLIYRSIMRYGVQPQPFFFKHLPAVRQQLLNDLKLLVDSL